MPLSIDIDPLVDLIDKHMSESMLSHAARNALGAEGFDAIAKGCIGREDRLRHIAAAVLAQVEGAARTRFLSTVYEQVKDFAPDLRDHLLGVLHPEQASALQAMHARRDSFFKSADLRRYFNEIEHQVCLIVGSCQKDGGDEIVCGTGFLVGPDLVLTTMHLFRHDNELSTVPQRFEVVFDHVRGPDISKPGQRNPGTYSVNLASDWLVKSSAYLADDGLNASTDAARRAQLSDNLDFALVRLAVRVGDLPVEASGGVPRNWVKLPLQKPLLGVDARIIISQHPGGNPRRFDAGRFKEFCFSDTRFRYDTEAAKGSSGAPCFDRDLELVGLHNAAYMPGGVQQSNQAVMLNKIRPLIEDTLKPDPLRETTGPTEPVLKWKLDVQGKEVIIIGRTVLLEWSMNAARERTEGMIDLRERVYCAPCPEPGAGKTFSISIAQAHMHSQDVMIVFDARNNRLPGSVEAFLRALLQTLGIPADEIDQMPPRPSPQLSNGVGDGDKIERWLSKLLPEWLDRMLATHRMRRIDIRESMRITMQQLDGQGIPVPAEIRQIARSPDAEWRDMQRWRLIWIAMDDVPFDTAPTEVQELLAAIIDAGHAHGMSLPNLMQLRWMFLGTKPGFLTDGEVTLEKLRPYQLDDKQMKSVLSGIWRARGEQVNEDLCGIMATVSDHWIKKMKDLHQPFSAAMHATQESIWLILKGSAK